MTDAASPFLATARRWWDAGWRGTLHIPYGRKAYPPDGFTGPGAPYLSKADLSGLVYEFTESRTRHNIALRMPDGPVRPVEGRPDSAIVVDGERYGVIGIDVDTYHGGGETLDERQAELGALPDTWRTSARFGSVVDARSGISYFRVPPGRTWRGKVGPGIDVIQAGHRYALTWPSRHPDGEIYRIMSPTGRIVEEIPDPRALPCLPESWERFLLAPNRVEAASLTHGNGSAWGAYVLDERHIDTAVLGEAGEWLAACRGSDAERPACRIVRNTTLKYLRELQEGHNRHDTCLAGSRALVAFGGEGHVGTLEGLRTLGAAFVPAVTSRDRNGRHEFVSMAIGAVRIAAAKNPEPRRGCGCSAWGDIPGATTRRPVPVAVIGESVHETALASPVRATGTGQAIVPADAVSGDPVPSDQGKGSVSPARPEEADFLDARLAEIVAERVLAGIYVWTAAAGWLRWDGRRYAESTDVEVGEAVRQWAIGEFVAAVTGRADSGRQKSLARVCGADRIGSITRLARGLVLRDYALFDADPDILVCWNGVVDLATSKLMPHDPARLVTKLAPVTWVEGATHRDWTKALAALPDDVRDWYQIRIGQSITGHMSPDDRMIIAQGSGQNAKGTIHGMIARVLGGYFCLVADQVLLADPNAHTTEILDLKGSRFALVEETPEARSLNVNRLKKVVGTDKITARRIRKDPVTFCATHCLFVSTNYKPLVVETDHGTWRRLLLVRFPYTYTLDPEKAQLPGFRLADPTLRDRLYRDAAEGADGPRARAVLAWLIEGARRWYEADRIMPHEPMTVTIDTLAWRAESDQIMAYATERLEWDEDSHIMAADMLADINDWLRERGANKWGDKVFSSRFGDHDEIKSHGVVKARRRAGQPGLSRTPNINAEWLVRAAEAGYRSDVPAQFWAWCGVRFRKPEQTDTESDTGENGQDHVTGVTADPGERLGKRYTRCHPDLPSHPSHDLELPGQLRIEVDGDQ